MPHWSQPNLHTPAMNTFNSAGHSALGRAHHEVTNDPDVKEHKRKRAEEAGMEPKGEGNTPATGTKQLGFVEKYVPRNFPDKFVIKERYCSTYAMRAVQQAAGVPTLSYIVFNTNSNFAMQSAFTNITVNPTAAGHQPNQRDNWAAQFGYYRVEQLKYRITVSNIAGQAFIFTGYTNSVAVSDVVVTLMRTQQITDISGTNQESLWEQKEADNVYLQSRNPGSTKTMHTFNGDINPEDYDIDPITTAADETWTAVGSNPATARLLSLSIAPAFPSNTTALLPEVVVLAFIEFEQTVQYAGYKPALRQTTS